MSKVKDSMFTDKEPHDDFFPDPVYDAQSDDIKAKERKFMESHGRMGGVSAWTATNSLPLDKGKIALALSKAQGELTNVEKAHEGYQGRYRFADLGQVLDVIRPVFSKHGLAFTQLIGDAPDGRVSVTTMILHESGQTLQTTSSMALHKQAGLSEAQAAGSVITYLRRYQITAMAGIAQEDTDAASEEKPKRQTRAKSAMGKTQAELDADRRSEGFQKPVPNPDKIRALLACEDLQTLKEMWSKLDKSEHKLYENVKEQRKFELQSKEADEQQKEL